MDIDPGLVVDHRTDPAEECIAKLLLEMSLEEQKSKTTFTGLTPLAERSILTALKRRQML